MNIWLIQTGEDIPFDEDIRKLRTAVLAEELAGRGHQVTWWASSFSHLRKEWIKRDETSLQLDSGVNIELLHGRGYTSNVSVARVIDHRVIARQFKRRTSGINQPDIVVCSLPPYDLAYEAARYSKRRGVPLIIDARDFWPDIFLDFVPRFLRPLARLALFSEFRMTRSAFEQADAITAMSEDVLDWALNYCDRERSGADKVFHLGFRTSPTHEATIPDWLAALDSRFIVAFIGTFSHYHSPVSLAKAARQLQSEGRNDIAIVIAGAGGDAQAQVETEVAGLSNVTLPGWLDQAGIDALLDQAAVGVCPTSSDAKFFPNKAFLYFSKGLPVLSAFQGELRKVLEKDGLGRYFDHGDAEALASHIKALCDDSSLYARLSEQVRHTFSQKYDENVIYGVFADHIEAIAHAAA